MAARNVSNLLKDKFRKLDKNKDGTLNFEELCCLLRQGKSDMKESEIRVLFDIVDQDHDGLVSFDEFVDYIHATLATSGTTNAARPGSLPDGDSLMGSSDRLLGDSTVSTNLLRLSTPGPGAYSVNRKHHVPGGTIAVAGQANRGGSIAEEKRRFHKYDLDHDGSLNFEELYALLKRGNPDVTEKEARLLMDSIGCETGRISFFQLLDYLHPPNGAEHWGLRRKLQEAFDVSMPGPGSYYDPGQDQVLANHRQAPKATIGRGPGHLPPAFPSESPGPGAYRDGEDRVLAGRRRSSSVCIGNCPRGLVPSDSRCSTRSSTPGPGEYSADDMKQSHRVKGPRATIGRGPGHLSLVELSRAQTASPGPGSYGVGSLDDRPRLFPGASRFGNAPGRGHLPGLRSLEKRQFRSFDENHDGNLDFEELCRLMRNSNPNLREKEIQGLFNSVDQNHDGKIHFNELVDYLHPAAAFEHSKGRRRLKEAFALTFPGPGDYSTTMKDPVRGGSFGRAPRL